jgi:hypothetical protein
VVIESSRIQQRKEPEVEQHIYHGNVTPEGLADFLVQRYDPQPDIQAQKIGQGETVAVQIGHGDLPEKIKHAVTVGITRATDSEQGIVVTMGQQQWITPNMAAYAAMMGLVSVLVTPWALFALLWPISDLIGSRTLPGDIWNTIETYVLSQGASLARTQDLAHPHIG